jgi:hypothetical protein
MPVRQRAAQYLPESFDGREHFRRHDLAHFGQVRQRFVHPLLEVSVIDDFDCAGAVVQLRDSGERNVGQRLEGVRGTF